MPFPPRSRPLLTQEHYRVPSWRSRASPSVTRGTPVILGSTSRIPLNSSFRTRSSLVHPPWNLFGTFPPYPVRSGQPLNAPTTGWSVTIAAGPERSGSRPGTGDGCEEDAAAPGRAAMGAGAASS